LKENGGWEFGEANGRKIEFSGILWNLIEIHAGVQAVTGKRERPKADLYDFLKCCTAARQSRH